MRPEQIKSNLNKPVRFTNPRLYIENAEYILTGATIRKKKETGELYYQAELTDSKCRHSLMYARLDEIERDEDHEHHEEPENKEQEQDRRFSENG